MAEQEVIDKILAASQAKIDSEVSGLLGAQLKTAEAENRFLSKADFFKPVKKIVLTTLKIEGDLEGEAFLAISLADAIRMGGTLIMLPEAELENHINKEIFGDDESDAFGEIANIIAGVYSANFEDIYTKKIRIFKSEINVVEPAKVDIDSDAPFPDQHMFVSSTGMEMDGNKLGALDILLPAELFGLMGAKTQTAAETSAAASEDIAIATESSALGQTAEPATAGDSPHLNSTLVVVVTDQNDQGELFSETLRSRGFTVKCLSLADDVKEFLSENPARGVFIILSKVNEQGVSSIIKVKTACGTCTPLIAGGPEWTRNTVLQAVKYGACDIVVTPIIQDEIIEKVQVHLGESPAAEESKVD